MLEKLVDLAHGKAELEEFTLLFLFAYAFLLRVPSEALPATAVEGSHALRREGDFLVFKLDRRKNRPEGSRLVRGCWCKESPKTCPLHKLSPLLERCQKGARLFPNLNESNVIGTLRFMLKALQVPKAEEYRTHDLRRGHAKDLQLSGERFICDSHMLCKCCTC